MLTAMVLAIVLVALAGNKKIRRNVFRKLDPSKQWKRRRTRSQRYETARSAHRKAYNLKMRGRR